ncbi:hypothetical protein GCM10022247_37350 [Allokutzneria multivorans]|uniref:YggT family protein n=1 Tax=Allokutzneria multivorans TaxID=1142134 RepID=A0ABP7SGS4_9PSEU
MTVEKDPQMPAWAVWVARVISVVIVVPLTFLWELLKAAGRVLIVRPAEFLGRWLFAPLGRYVLRPIGVFLRAVWDVLARALRVVALPIGRVLRQVLAIVIITPVAWLAKYLVVVPLSWLWRFALAPAGRLFGAACAWAYERVALPLWRFFHRFVFSPLWRGTRAVLRVVVVAPARWVRDTVITPVRLAGRRLRQHIGSALFGRRPS